MGRYFQPVEPARPTHRHRDVPLPLPLLLPALSWSLQLRPVRPQLEFWNPNYGFQQWWKWPILDWETVCWTLKNKVSRRIEFWVLDQNWTQFLLLVGLLWEPCSSTNSEIPEKVTLGDQTEEQTATSAPEKGRNHHGLYQHLHLSVWRLLHCGLRSSCSQSDRDFAKWSEEEPSQNEN